MSIELRQHPYPFRCSMTICSDLERCSFNDFVTIHRFLNTHEKTTFGIGLGLEISDSFWMYSADSGSDNSFPYFESLSTTPSKYAPFIREGIWAGYIDCLYTYGHFNKQGQYGGFRRRMAEAALQELRDQQLRVAVWMNDGNPQNLQNIANTTASTTQAALGDLPMQPQLGGETMPVDEYHTDLTLDYGIRYAWVGDLTATVGQDRPLQNRRNFKQTLKELLTGTPAAKAPDNRLINAVDLRDGRKLFTFKRYLADLQWGRDYGDDLHQSLATEKLQTLIDTEGVMIAYAHIGKKRGKELFGGESLAALRHLSSLVAEGKIWVTTTSRLLEWNRKIHYLNWQSQNNGERFFIHVYGTQDPVLGNNVIELEDLAGLTWYTPSPERTSLILHRQKERTEIRLQQNDKDHTGRRSVMLPLRPLNPKNWPLLYESGFKSPAV